MKTIAMLNQKGGCGKSTVTTNLGGAFAEMGLKCLVLDGDPQSSISQGIWGPVAVRALDPSETIAALYRGENPHPERIIKPTGIPGLDVVPGSRAINSFNVPDPWLAPHELQTCLKTFVDEVAGSYPIVLLDCPPNLCMNSYASLLASDALITPFQPEDYASMGIIDIQESVALVQAGPNPSLRQLGYLLTMVKRRETIHRQYEETVRELYGDLVFKTCIPRAQVFVAATARRLPVTHYKPKDENAQVIRDLAAEILGRLEVAPVEAEVAR